MKVFRGCDELLVLLGDSEGLCLTPLSSCPIHLLSSMYVEAVKGIRNRRKKTWDIFRFKFYFGGLRLIWSGVCFPEPTEISRTSPNKALKEISRNYSWQIERSRICHVSLCSVGRFSRGCN